MILSRRDFFSIFLMMLALFFLFQFSQIVKSVGNQYDENDHVTESTLKSSDVIIPDSNECVWIIGADNGKIMDSASQWCTYTKLRQVRFDYIPKPVTKGNVKAIIIDTKTVNIKGKSEELYALAGMGATMIFANLPEAEYIEEDEALKNLLGISEVIDYNIHIDGIQMFDGFLLGGEVVYTAKDEEEKERYEDIPMDIPWYDTGIGTKTYIVGIMDESKVLPYDFPKIIWRSYYNGTYIYCVNGDYCDGMMGIGFYDSMMYDVSDYYIYPVVNANNIVMADFPYLSNENMDRIKEIYSRNVEGFQKDIAWPGIVAMATKRDFSMTCFLSSKYDYSGYSEYGKDLIFYLQQMKEIGAEAGKSVDFRGNLTLDQKIKSDKEFYDSQKSNYNYRCTYIQDWNPELPKLLKENGTPVKSIVCAVREGEPVLSFCDEDTTLQYTTNKAENYTFKNGLLYKSLLTSLGYSNVLIDMKSVIWPETEEDEWQNFFDYVYSFMTTYWTDENGFDDTTISESDYRIRNMLTVNFVSQKTARGVMLRTENVDESWFILRTHEEEIDNIENGEYTRIEEDAYLIHAFKGETRIDLKESEEIYRYDSGRLEL